MLGRLKISWNTPCHRCPNFSKPPYTLPSQPHENRDNTSGEWKASEAGVHPLSSFCLWWCWHLLLWLCQNHRWRWNNLDGEQLRRLLTRSIWSDLLPAADHNDQKQQSGYIFPHKQLCCKHWLESQLDIDDTRSEGSRLNVWSICIVINLPLLYHLKSWNVQLIISFCQSAV